MAAGADQVIAALQIPEGGSLDSWRFTSHVIGVDAEFLQVEIYELAGYMINIPDPDSSQTPDVTWDTNVMKDTALVITAASGELEVDTETTADTSPVEEIGVPALQNILTEWGPDELLAPYVKMISIADSIGGFKDATPDTYLPRDIVSKKGGGSGRVDSPSMALWALGSPTLDATVTAWFEADTPAEWAQLQYLEWVLEQAFIEVIGLTEAGAESPWADAATLLVNNLIAFFEQTAGAFNPITWNVFTSFSARVTVPGTFEKQSLSLGW